MSTGLTGESPSDELVLVLSCKLVFYFIVGGMKNLRGRMGYVSAHISILERQIALTFVLILGWSLLALDILLDLSSFLIPCFERSSLSLGTPSFSTGENVLLFLPAVPNHRCLLIQDRCFLLAFLAAPSTCAVGQ